MAQDNIPKNQVKSRNSIEQREHEDDAAARRVTPVDADGDFHDETNPAPSLQFFIRNGAPQAVVEDTLNPTNNRPLPVKLTGFDGDVIINSENLNLETQSDGFYDAVENADPDSVGLIAHERSVATDESKQIERPTAKRGTSDTDTVSQDVSLHDHDGNKFTETNQLPTNSSIRDGANPAIKAQVDADLNLHVELHGNAESGLDKTLLLSERGGILVGKVSTLNSTTAPLIANGSFTGTFEEVKDYAFLSVFINSNVASVSAGLEFHWTDDPTFAVWRTEVTNLVAGASRAFSLGVRARYFRIKYTNGSTAQVSFVLGVVLHPSGTGMLTKPLGGSVDVHNFAQLVQAPVMAKLLDDTFVNIAGVKLDSTSLFGVAEADTIFADQGKAFTVTTDVISAGSTAERPFLLIDNPVSSGKKLYFNKIMFGIPESGNTHYRMYMNPTVTANGTLLTPVGNRQSGQASGVTNFYTLPTVSVNGSKFMTFRVDNSGTSIIYDYEFGRLLEPGNKLLITVAQSVAANGGHLDIEYAEI